MEIRDPLHGNLAFMPPEVAVINSEAFQRLRSIKQLGFSEFSFPGATHNRFLHSLGVCHLAGLAFDNIFRLHSFKNRNNRQKFRQVLRLAALLHDVGHGPLSHTTEEVMPPIAELQVEAYSNLPEGSEHRSTRKANHEDYTIKYITDSPLAAILRENFPDMEPIHIACLIDRKLITPDDFFIDGEINFRPILSQLVSSEMDLDRMDYLERDAYYCGTNYGRVEISWLLSNLAYHVVEGDLHLALNRRALYTFDDFLISRHHMHLMVYFHHKSIIFEEMLHRYLTSKDCKFFLPADIIEYTKCTDYSLYQHLASVDDKWAKRISSRQQTYRMLFEYHTNADTPRLSNMKKALEAEGIDVILSNSKARLSKYHSSYAEEGLKIYVVDQYDRQQKPFPIEQTTEIFIKYEETRAIERAYVSPENFDRAEKIVIVKKL